MRVLDVAKWQLLESQLAQTNDIKSLFDNNSTCCEQAIHQLESLVNWLAFWFFPSSTSHNTRQNNGWAVRTPQLPQHQKHRVLKHIHEFFSSLLQQLDAFAHESLQEPLRLLSLQKLLLELAILLAMVQGGVHEDPQVHPTLACNPLEQMLQHINHPATNRFWSRDALACANLIWSTTCDVLLLLLSELSFAFGDHKANAHCKSKTTMLMITNTQLKLHPDLVARTLHFCFVAVQNTLFSASGAALTRSQLARQLLHQTPELINSMRKYFQNHQGDVAAKDGIRTQVVQLINRRNKAHDQAREIELCVMIMILFSTLDQRSAFGDPQLLIMMMKCIENQTRSMLSQPAKKNCAALFDSLAGMTLGVGVFVSSVALQDTSAWWRVILVQYLMLYQNLVLPLQLEQPLGCLEFNNNHADPAQPSVPSWQQELAQIQQVLRLLQPIANGLVARNATFVDRTLIKEVQDVSLLLLDHAVQQLVTRLSQSSSSLYFGTMMAFQKTFVSPKSFKETTAKFLQTPPTSSTTTTGALVERKWPHQQVCRYFCRGYLMVTCCLEALISSTVVDEHEQRSISTLLLEAYRLVTRLEFCRPLVTDPPERIDWMKTSFWSRIELDWRRDSLQLLQRFQEYHAAHFSCNKGSYFSMVIASSLKEHQATSGSETQIPWQHNYVHASELLAYGLLIQRNVRAVLVDAAKEDQESALHDFETTLDLVFAALFHGFQPLDDFAQRFVTFLLAFLPHGTGTNAHRGIHERRIVPGLVNAMTTHFPTECSQQTFTKLLGAICSALFANPEPHLVAFEESQGLMLWSIQRFAELSIRLLQSTELVLQNQNQTAAPFDGLFVVQLLCELLKLMPFTGIVPCAALQLERIMDQVVSASTRHALMHQIESVLFQHCEQSRRAWLTAWWIDVRNKYQVQETACLPSKL